MRALIVTAADDGFFPLLQGLILSLLQWPQRPFSDIAVFDLGLEPASRAWTEKSVRYVVTPDWDLPVDETSRRANKPHYRAVTARPFLPRYFPGYDIYLWLDADTWVQQRFVLDAYIALAARGFLVAVPETHPSYRYKTNVVQWRFERMSAYFGANAATNARWDFFVNSGVFALSANAPHWAAWAQYLAAGLKNADFAWFSDQTALNYAVWRKNLPTAYLPAYCNWLCHLAMPDYDEGLQLFCEPNETKQAIGIIHLAGETKDAVLDGITMSHPRSLRYPATQSRSGGLTTINQNSTNRGILF